MIKGNNMGMISMAYKHTVAANGFDHGTFCNMYTVGHF